MGVLVDYKKHNLKNHPKVNCFGGFRLRTVAKILIQFFEADGPEQGLYRQALLEHRVFCE